MPMIEVEVWCSCGNGLCNQSTTERRGKGIVVEPCPDCLEKARDEGYAKGYDNGQEEGYSMGYSSATGSIKD